MEDKHLSLKKLYDSMVLRTDQLKKDFEEYQKIIENIQYKLKEYEKQTNDLNKYFKSVEDCKNNGVKLYNDYIFDILRLEDNESPEQNKDVYNTFDDFDE